MFRGRDRLGLRFARLPDGPLHKLVYASWGVREGAVMAFKIPIGPSQLALHLGNAVLVTDRDGQIPFPSDKGLYFLDTRLISSWQVYANGEQWDLLNSAAISHYAARIFLINRGFTTQDGDIAPQTIGLGVGRWLDGGLHEDLDIINYGVKPVRFNLEVAIRSDFADLFEVKRKKNRAARPNYHRVVGRWAAMPDGLPQQGFLSRDSGSR